MVKSDACSDGSADVAMLQVGDKNGVRTVDSRRTCSEMECNVSVLPTLSNSAMFCSNHVLNEIGKEICCNSMSGGGEALSKCCDSRYGQSCTLGVCGNVQTHFSNAESYVNQPNGYVNLSNTPWIPRQSENLVSSPLFSVKSKVGDPPAAGFAHPRAENKNRESGKPLLPNAWKKPLHLMVSSLTLGNITNDGKSVAFDRFTYGKNKEKLEKGLVGKLFGRRLPLHILDRELSNRWAHVGGFRTVLIRGDCFLCIFESAEARDSILMDGPWQIMGNIIGMDRWTPKFDPDSMIGLSSPVWVRFPRLPLLFWDNITIARIATMLGEPLWIDALTTEWGRSEFARVCVRLDLSKKLPSGVWIEEEDERFFQPIEYEGISMLCFKCGIVGHKMDSCPKLCAASNQQVRDKRRPYSDVCRGKDKVMVTTSSHEVGETSHKQGVGCNRALELSAPLQPSSTPFDLASASEDEDEDLGTWVLVTRNKRAGANNKKWGKYSYKQSGIWPKPHGQMQPVATSTPYGGSLPQDGNSDGTEPTLSHATEAEEHATITEEDQGVAVLHQPSPTPPCTQKFISGRLGQISYVSAAATSIETEQLPAIVTEQPSSLLLPKTTHNMTNPILSAASNLLFSAAPVPEQPTFKQPTQKSIQISATPKTAAPCFDLCTGAPTSFLPPLTDNETELDNRLVTDSPDRTQYGTQPSETFGDASIDESDHSLQGKFTKQGRFQGNLDYWNSEWNTHQSRRKHRKGHRELRGLSINGGNNIMHESRRAGRGSKRSL